MSEETKAKDSRTALRNRRFSHFGRILARLGESCLDARAVVGLSGVVTMAFSLTFPRFGPRFVRRRACGLGVTHRDLSRVVRDYGRLGAGCFWVLSLACVPRAQVRGLEDALRNKEAGCQEQAKNFQSRLAVAQQDKGRQREQIRLCELQSVQLQRDFESLQAQNADLRNERVELSERLAKVVHDRVALESTMAELQGALRQAQDRKREEQLFASQEDRWMRHFGPKMRESGAGVALRDEGMVIVIPSDPIFQLNSASLSSQGQELMQAVAQQLRRPEFSSYRFQVRGHTDNVPTRTATLLDNWDVSSARALAVLHLLIREGLDPARLSSAGFGEYLPRTENLTRDGRQKNRRIEILLQRRHSIGR